MDKIIKYLEEEIRLGEQYPDDLDEKNRANETGIIISVNEAKKIIDVLKRAETKV